MLFLDRYNRRSRRLLQLEELERRDVPAGLDSVLNVLGVAAEFNQAAMAASVDPSPAPPGSFAAVLQNSQKVLFDGNSFAGGLAASAFDEAVVAAHSNALASLGISLESTPFVFGFITSTAALKGPNLMLAQADAFTYALQLQTFTGMPTVGNAFNLAVQGARVTSDIVANDALVLSADVFTVSRNIANLADSMDKFGQAVNAFEVQQGTPSVQAMGPSLLTFVADAKAELLVVYNSVTAYVTSLQFGLLQQQFQGVTAIQNLVVGFLQSAAVDTSPSAPTGTIDPTSGPSQTAPFTPDPFLTPDPNSTLSPTVTPTPVDPGPDLGADSAFVDNWNTDAWNCSCDC
jgi:hypothetical protein